MSQGFLTVLFFVGLFVCVFASPKLNINMGFMGIFMAFIIGRFFGGVTRADIVALFPVTIVVIMLMSTCFFGFIRRTGVFKGVADRILWAFRKHPAAIPYAIYAATWVVSALGAGGFAGPAIMSPLAYALALEVGFDPLLGVAAVVCGSGATSQLLWQSTTAVHRGWLEKLAGPEYVDQTLIFIVLVVNVMLLGAFTIQYILSKGYRPKSAVGNAIQKPEPFTSGQKKALYGIVGFIALAAVPPIANMLVPNVVCAWLANYFDIYMIFAIGIVVLTILKVAPIADVIKEDIPWSAVVMVAGMMMYVGLVNALGVVDVLSSILGSCPKWAITPFVVLVGGIIAAFVNGNALISSLVPIIQAAIALFPSLSITGSYAALYFGICAAIVSPFSTGGNLAQMGITDDTIRSDVTRRQVFFWLITVAVALVISFTGVFGIPKP